MIAEVYGIRLFYEKSGAGRSLVMVHGNGEDHTIFDEAVRKLRNEYCCYRLDSRCHGQSEDTRELHYRDMATDVIAFLKALDLLVSLVRDIFLVVTEQSVVGVLDIGLC